MDPNTLSVMQGAAGAGGDKVYVEDVFSTDVWHGTGTNHRIQNGIALGATKPEDGNSLNLSATHQRLTRTSALSGASASKTFTFSAWVKIPDTSVSGYLFYIQDDNPSNQRFAISIYDHISISAWNSSNVKFLDAYMHYVPITPGAWNHILISLDMTSTSNRYCYINDSSVSLTWQTYGNDSILFNSSEVAIFGEKSGMPWQTNTNNKIFGSLSNFYFDQTYRDLSTTSERRKFYAADGTPATGQASLSPIIYYNCDTLSTTNAGSGGDFTFIDSPTLNDFGPYIGTGEAKGGMVWVKQRSSPSEYAAIVDTERGRDSILIPSEAWGTFTSSSTQDITTFNEDGFSLGPAVNYVRNTLGKDNVAWSFRKAPGFFDVVTWSGNNDADVAIPHSLGSEPGMVVVKRIDENGTQGASNWYTYHRSLASPLTKWLSLNKDVAEIQANPGVNMWGSMTSTHIGIRDYLGLNTTGKDYVAYIFAHDDQRFGEDEDESIIKCGTFEGTAGTEVNLGFEPQFLLIKTIDSTRGWFLIDNLRGVSHDYNRNSNFLYANTSADEDDNRNIFITPTGFEVCTSTAFANDTNIYMAIRRPHKKPAAGTEVFAAQDGRTASNATSSQNTWTSGFPVDLIMRHTKASGAARTLVYDRIRNWDYYLRTHDMAGEAPEGSVQGDGDYVEFDNMDGVYSDQSVAASTNSFAHMFKRAPGFMDIVTYMGTGSTRTVDHNLGVAPELVIVKCRDGSVHWYVQSAELTSYSHTLSFNYAAEFLPGTGADILFPADAPTSTVFRVGDSNGTNNGSVPNVKYIAYLFATLPGISKVSSYTGTGNDIDVDCGFTNGARFVLVKRTDQVLINGEDHTGHWYLWDSVSGITSGNDPHLYLNDELNGQITGTDYIDPLTTGFTITSSAPDAVNASGGTYIYLAIA